MTKPLSNMERRRLAVELADFFPVRHDMTGKHGEPYAKRDEGRDRRKARRQAIARKREFLA